jgi:hypothetical protein
MYSTIPVRADTNRGDALKRTLYLFIRDTPRPGRSSKREKRMLKFYQIGLIFVSNNP